MTTKTTIKTTLLAAAGVAALASLAPTSASAFGHFGGGFGHGPVIGHGGFGGGLRDPGFGRGRFGGGYHWGGYRWGGYPWGGYRFGYGYPWGGYRWGYGAPVSYSLCPLGTFRSVYGVCVPRFRPL